MTPISGRLHQHAESYPAQGIELWETHDRVINGTWWSFARVRWSNGQVDIGASQETPDVFAAPDHSWSLGWTKEN